MKNYPHLYPSALNKKVIQLNRTPKKTKTVTTNVLNSKASQKTIFTYNTLNRQKYPHVRNMTRSIEQLRAYSDVSNQQKCQHQMLGTVNDQEQLFSQSYSKIGQIKQTFCTKNIDFELNEVLTLIKQQKAKITEKMKAIKKSNDQYKMLCEKYMIIKNECGTNTEDIIDHCAQVASRDQGIDCEIITEPIKIVEEQTIQENQEMLKQVEKPTINKQAYMKISKMLQQMKINPKEILPQQNVLPGEIEASNFNALSQKEIIKIQKFFIRKLLEKIPK